MEHKFLLRTALSLLVAFMPKAMTAGDLSVSGRVTDSTGSPVAGVIVTVEGTGVSTLTDGGGNFTLPASVKADALLFHMLGLEDKRLPIDSEVSQVEVCMGECKDIQDVAVSVGYGTLDRKELSSSVSSVSSCQLGERPSALNLTQALAGKVAGYSVHNTSGRPGGSNTVYIRGKWGVNNDATPLYVVDGMVDVNIEMLNPEDIASIAVLKDAAATAIYGARGANGVVVVTTKSGCCSEGTISYSGTVGVSESTRNYPELDNVYVNGLSHGHHLSFAKSNERNSVYASLGYKSMEGILKGTDANRLSTAFNFTSKINNWLDVKFGADFSSGVDNRGDLVFDDLVYKAAFEENHVSMASGYDYNTMLDKAAYRQRRQQMMFNGAGDVHLAKGLTFTVRGDYRGDYSIFGKSAPGGIEGATVANNGFANITNYDIFRWSNDDYLTYEKTFGKLKTTSVLGASLNYLLYESSYSGTTDFSDNQYEYYRMQAGTVYDQSTSAYAKRAMTSVYFRTNMVLDGKYLFGLTVRSDSASNYGEDKRSGIFPAASLGWIVSEEPWFDSIRDSFSLFKLRASFGSVGNAGVFVNAEPVTRNLDWEDSRQLDFGLDLSFWKGRVNLSADFYNTDIHNVFYRGLVPSEAGYSSVWRSIDLIRNRGFEVTLNTRPVVSEGFNWNLDLIYSHNTSTAEEIGSRVDNPLSPIYSEAGGAWNTLSAGPVTPQNEFNLVNTLRFGGFTFMVDVAAKSGFWTYCDNWTTRYQKDPTSLLPWTATYDSKNVVKGNYLRLRNILLTYDLKRNLLKNVSFFRGMTLGVSAENVYTVTDVPTIDPEDFTWDGRIGVSGGAYPRPMSISGTLRLTF